MGLLQQKGITSLGSGSSSSGSGLLQRSGITSIGQKPKTTSGAKPIAKITVTPPKPTKQTVKVEPSKNFDIKKLGSAIVAGTKTLPGMAKQAGGIILQNLVQTSRFADNFFKPINKINNIVLPKKLEEYRTKQEKAKEAGRQGVEKIAGAIRESGQRSQSKVIQDYAKKQTPSKGIQGYLEMAAFNLPQMAGTVALTVGTAIVTKNPFAASAVGLSSTYGMGASEVYSEARKNGLSDKQALPLAQAGGVLIGILDYIPLTRFLRKTGAVETIKKSIAKKIASQVVSVGTQAGFEGITEAGQEIVGNAIAKTYNENKGLFENVKEAGIVGALLGGVGDVTVSGVIGAKGKTAQPQEVITNIEDKIDQAFKTPSNKRSLEQKTIVAGLLNENVTANEALAKVAESDLNNTEVGRKIVLTALEAQKQGKNVQISLSEDQKSVDIDIVGAEETRLEMEKVRNTPIETLIEQNEGWQEGEKVKFDTALHNKDVEGLKALIPTAPKEYKAKFKAEIDAVLGKPKKSKTEKVTSTPTIGTPKLAQGVKAKAIKNKLIYGFDKTFNNLPEYDRVNVKEQGQKATELVLSAPEEAFEIAMGRKQAPSGVLPESVFVAVENYATETKNVDMLRQLATESELTMRATGMGQSIRMLGERNPDSVVKKIRDIAEARQESFKKKHKGKSIGEVKNKLVRDIQKKVVAPNKYDWNSFINSIEC